MLLSKLHTDLNNAIKPSWPIMVTMAVAAIAFIGALIYLGDPSLMAAALAWIYLP